MRTSFKTILAESRVFKGQSDHVIIRNRLYFEWVSQYRRITVVEDSTGFEIRVTYRGLAKDSKPWSIRWAVLVDALAWAEYYASNMVVIINSSLTAKDFNGKRVI